MDRRLLKLMVNDAVGVIVVAAVTVIVLAERSRGSRSSSYLSYIHLW